MRFEDRGGRTETPALAGGLEACRRLAPPVHLQGPDPEGPPPLERGEEAGGGRGPGAGPDRGRISLAQTPGRVISMAAVEEMKGGAQQEKEPCPAAPLPSGAGYIKTPPNPAGRWGVTAHEWSPGTSVVQRGETVTLEIVGVNAEEYPSTILKTEELFAAVEKGS